MHRIIIPLILAILAVLSLHQKENAYSDLTEGAADGLKIMCSIVPSLIILLSAISALRASGAMEVLSDIMSPALKVLGIPSETILLILVRPMSGSAALAIGAELIHTYGPDSLVGRTAAVMLGSTETTFYTISIYLGTWGIQKTKYILPAALLADLTGFVVAAFTVQLFYP